MMQFRVIKNAIIDLLAANAAGRFRVVGSSKQGIAASEIKGQKRVVQVFFANGKFPGSAGGYGDRTHQIIFSVGLYVSAAASADLSAINNPQATPQQIAAALTALQEGSSVADNLWDELAEIVFQIISDNRNRDLGLPIGNVASLWISEIIKEDPVPAGSLVALDGRVVITLNTSEDVTGDVLSDPVADVVLQSPNGQTWLLTPDDLGNAVLESTVSTPPSQGVTFRSPDGTLWQLGADNDGNLTLTAV